MRSSVRSSLIVGIFVLVACTPTGSDATTTTQPATTISTQPQPVPSEACSSEPHTPLDSSARAVQSIVADVDGDGFEDTVTGYLLGSSDPAEATAAFIHVELASGWGTALQIDELQLADGPTMAEPRRVVTMDGDPLLVVGVAGISTRQLFAFFTFADCRLEVVTTSDGELPEVWVGGGRTHDDWFTCDSDRVLMVQFATSNPDAEPKMYGAGAAQTYVYAEGEFTISRSDDLDAALPATRAEMASVYPSCAG